MSQTLYRAYCPTNGPAKKPDDLAHWAVREMLALPGMIWANPRDLTALRSTMLAERIAGAPQHGVVQPGTVWLEVAT